jgi:hypothetical protein
VGGRDSKRVQRGFASERDAAEALERELERLRREQQVARSLTLGQLVEVYLAQHDVDPATAGNGFGLFSALPGPSDLPLIATSCNHGAPQRLHPTGEHRPRRHTGLRGRFFPWWSLSRSVITHTLARGLDMLQRQSAAPDEASGSLTL